METGPDPAGTVRAYYDALRAGEPLGPFFADDALVKFGIGERLDGAAGIRAGLREQTATTDAWQVDSRGLRVDGRDCHAWFADEVFMAWTDTERAIRFEFDTRWSGTMERARGADRAPGGDHDPGADHRDGDGGAPTPGRGGWRFLSMHVSTEGGT